MAPLWLTLSALCLVGAAVLLYVDIDHRRGRGRRRRSWAKSHGFDYESTSEDVLKRWQYGLMSTIGDVTASNVVLGQIRGEAVYILDIEQDATIIALHRKVFTDVVVDIRMKACKAPREDNILPLGEIGSRVIYSTNLDAARRVCDRRMAIFAHSAPEHIEIMWNEPEWALISMPVDSSRADWDEGLRVVRKFSDLLRVLPPSSQAKLHDDCERHKEMPRRESRRMVINQQRGSLSRVTESSPLTQSSVVNGSARSNDIAMPRNSNGQTGLASQSVPRLSALPRRPATRRYHNNSTNQ